MSSILKAGRQTSLIVNRSALCAPASASYTGLMDDTYVLSMMTLLIDCSACWNDGFVGTKMSCIISTIRHSVNHGH